MVQHLRNIVYTEYTTGLQISQIAEVDNVLY